MVSGDRHYTIVEHRRSRSPAPADKEIQEHTFSGPRVSINTVGLKVRLLELLTYLNARGNLCAEVWGGPSCMGAAEFTRGSRQSAGEGVERESGG